MKLGLCYEWRAKHRLARRLYYDLLKTQEVQNDKTLLSAVYRHLAKVSTKSTTKERFDFLELALECLPDDSIHRLPVYRELAIALMRVGDFSGAMKTLERAEECANHQEIDLTFLRPFRGSLLQSTGDFRAAKQLYLSYIAAEATTNKRFATVSLTGVLNNVAVCFDCLGDINSAIEYQLRARRVADHRQQYTSTNSFEW